MDIRVKPTRWEDLCQAATRLHDSGLAAPASLAGALDAFAWDNAGEALALLFENFLTDCRLSARLFPPALLVDAVIALLEPQPGDTVFDPAMGAGQFLIAADAYIQTVRADQGGPPARLSGQERDPALRRLADLNLALHRIVLDHPPGAAAVVCGTLASQAEPGPLLAECLAQLQPDGRAALVVPDSLLYRDDLAPLRATLLNTCNLHTLLRLPGGLCHSSASLLFFDRAGPTAEVWVYDMRTGLPWRDAGQPLTHEDIARFEAAYAGDARGARQDSGEQGRFRPFARTELAEDSDNLDIFWLDETDRTSLPPDLCRWMGEELGALQHILRGQ